MGVKLVITNISFEVQSDLIVAITNKAMVLSPENALDVVQDHEKYKGFTFVLDYREIHARKNLSSFNVVVSQLVSIWKHLEWSFVIILSSKEPIVLEDGILSIDKRIRAYLTEATYQ